MDPCGELPRLTATSGHPEAAGGIGRQEAETRGVCSRLADVAVRCQKAAFSRDHACHSFHTEWVFARFHWWFLARA